MPLHRGTHPTSYAVPLHRAAQYLAHRESNSWTRTLGAPAIKNRHVAREMLPAFLVDRLKICVPEQS